MKRKRAHKVSRLMTGALALALLLVSCSEEKIIEVPADCPPAAPRGVFAINLDGYVSITWWANMESDVVRYRVYTSVAYDGTYELIGVVNVSDFPPGTTEFYFDDFDVRFAEQWFYAVTAVDRAGNESELSPEEVTGTPRPEFYLQLYGAQFEPDLSGYDLSDLSDIAQHWDLEDTDIYVRDNAGIPEIVADYPRVQIQDYGYAGSFDDLNWAPTEGWAPSGRVEAIENHVYFVRISELDGYHYAKLYIELVASTYIELWSAYQLGAYNRDLAPAPPGSGDDEIDSVIGLSSTEGGSRLEKELMMVDSPPIVQEGNMDRIMTCNKKHLHSSWQL
jgi:hypothetical protein